MFKNWKVERVLPWLLVVGGVLGIAASLFLTYDQIKIWENPHYTPACDLNPIVSCGTVINSKQGDIFGIPGPFFGLLAFPVLTTFGVILLSGVKLKRWLWLGLEAGGVGGVLFALWLFWVSLFRVHALCPFCLSVDVIVYTLFWYITQYNLKVGNIILPGKLTGAGDFVRKHHLDLLILWFLILFAFTLNHFWYYYGQHIKL